VSGFGSGRHCFAGGFFYGRVGLCLQIRPMTLDHHLRVHGLVLQQLRLGLRGGNVFSGHVPVLGRGWLGLEFCPSCCKLRFGYRHLRFGDDCLVSTNDGYVHTLIKLLVVLLED